MNTRRRPRRRRSARGPARRASPRTESVPPVGSVDFGDLRRYTPISRVYGYDRGQPVDRRYIEEFLRSHAADIRGRVLEIEDDGYTRSFGERVRESDVLHLKEGHPGTTIVADLADAPQIPDARYDCVIFTQTLQYIYETRAAIATLGRILKPGGVLLATFPGLSATSDPQWSDRWYWNFTSRSARRLFAEAFSPENVEVRGHGNVFVAAAFLYGLASSDLSPEDFDAQDEGFEITITVRAVNP